MASNPTLQVDIVSAEKLLYSGVAEMVVAPAVNGQIGILPRHAQLITHLLPGEVRVTVPDEEQPISIYVSGGILEVQPNHVTVLSDTAVRAKDLDEAAALEARKKAEEAISNKHSDIDLAQAQSMLAESIAQLNMIRKRKSK
ncbi:MAG: F0F1 ATP synthase subunit epsilon [Gammaproteobacteria bacterium]|nr:F0F1 ATP synthase subunit epsilon [Gammaproteobacteria bacterium]